MREADWNRCTDPKVMLEFLRDDRNETRRRSGRRKLRLFACACLRGIWHILRQPGSREAVEVAERFADGAASDEQLAEAHAAARRAFRRECLPLDEGHEHAYWQSSEAATHVASRRFSGGDHESVSHAAGSAATAWVFGTLKGKEYRRRSKKEHDARQAAHAGWLRDIYGPLPFRTVGVDPRWRTPLVLSLARAAYGERVAPDPSRPGWLVLDSVRLLVLADALEEAGCGDGDILGHLRGSGPHCLGCWCLDRLVGKS
jgi:hypothetical protein